MAPKRRGRPPKAGKPADEKKKPEQAVAPEEPAEKAVEVAKEEEEEEEEDDEGKPVVAEPSPKKTKVEEKKKRGRQPKAAAAKKATASSKKGAEIEEKAVDEEEAEEGLDEQAPAAKSEKFVIIEASKECTCFKTRAAKVQEGLIKAIPGIEVLINPDKPRKGCFEVRSKDGDVYLSMLGLPRPFTKLKNLDMDKAVEEIVAKVK